MSIFLVKAFTLPQLNAAMTMAVLYGIIVVALILKKEEGKYLLPFFGIVCVVDFLVSGVPRPWLILTVTGLLLCYELSEFSFRHDVQVGDEELHSQVMKTHAVYLAVMFSVIVAASFGTLFLFGRVGFRFSDSVYMNALIFSVIFFAVLYLLRYVSK